MEFFGKNISGQFTIPSGIVTTYPKIIQKLATEIPSLGVITTKSVGIEPKTGNREPIITKYGAGSFSNAVGLTNPGIDEFASEMSKIEIPKNKFLLTSVFGKNAEEFVIVAKKAAKFSDGIELNLSCPHAKGYGMAIGQDKELVKEITRAVKAEVKIPVITKLTPNAPNVGEIAKYAVEGGADGICAINTVGPGLVTFEGNPILTNKQGGLSGRSVLPIGLKCVKEIRSVTDVPIIGCGGIFSAADVLEYEKAGANIFGIGSALAGLDSEEIKSYFSLLEKDLITRTNTASSVLKEIDMAFTKFTLVENQKLADNMSLLVFDKQFTIKSGQFVFIWIPGLGEKPFSVLDTSPMKLLIQNYGVFSEQIIKLDKGAEVFVRGPYGKALNLGQQKKIIIVGGGTGGSALYQIAKENKNTEVFFGSRDKSHLYFVDELKKCSIAKFATNDGSFGHKGFVTDLLKERLNELKGEEVVFYNCGPEPMINAAMAIEKELSPKSKIWNSVDYKTKCGVGICGSCFDKHGHRSCVDGPFLEVTTHE